ncbi:MAG: SdrD B-like domain-containing protein [Actinomycetes bacterium]
MENEWHRALAAEQAAQAPDPKPGAPFTDPCPTGARQVNYDVSVIQRDLVYNDDGWHDPQGRILVLSKDVEAVLAGTKKPEPLFFRVNAGDCVNYSLTNLLPNWYGGDAFQVLQQTNMFGQHIHLVKFDVLASDGSSNGWNYQQAAFTAQQARFNANIIDGTQSCTADEATGACRLPLPGSFDPAAAGAPPGQTIHERWYADYELRTAFTHDHHFPAVDQGRGLYGGLIVEPSGMDFRDSRTGEYHQPINDPAHGQVCSTSCTGTAAGAMFDVIGPGAKDDFREFGLSIQDFVPLIRAGGDPTNPADAFNPPEVPETFADDDPGVMGINYRNEPFLIRDTVNGVRTDPAYVFSSTVHGDPATPLLEAYGGDPVRMRVIQGSQEEQHVMAVHGMRWRQEPDDPDSPYVAATSIGVSEAFNFEIPEMECVDNSDCRGDYLYSGTSTDDLYLGAWGLMRVYGKGKQGLVPLPDNQPQAANGTINLNVTGETPPPANKPGKACPADAPVRSFTVAATDARIDYNRQGDHDPYGLIYVAAEPGETVADAVARAKADPEPMALRANEGDCIEVRLHNRIDPQGRFATTHAPLGAADGDPALPLEPPTGTPAGLRVSLHPQLLRYDVRGSDGATVGFNRDQTVAPGEDILYRWFADDVTPGELGALNLTDYGDVRGHRHHGLFAGLTIEPRGAKYHDPFTGKEIVSGMAADVRLPGKPDFRDFTSFFQDGLNLRDASGAEIPDGFAHPPVPGEPAETVDAEDRGEKAFGYRSSPYRHRLGITPMAADATSPMTGSDLASVLSSTVHGDPDTPMLRAYAGDPVRVRLLQGADKPRQHTFTVRGHSWRAQPDDPGSTLVGTTGGLSVGRVANLELAGAGNGRAGDYLYADPVAFHHLSGGAWGILRAYPAPEPAPLFTPSPLASGAQTDSPYRTGYHPLLPLELSSVRVHVYDDTDMDGTKDADEAIGPAQKVRLVSADPAGTSLEQPLDANGDATFWVGRGAYDVVVTAPADWQLTGPGTVRVDLTADGAAENVSSGMVQLGDAAVLVFNDKDGDSSPDTGEGPLADWPVTLERGTDKRTGTTDADGRAVFNDLVPGEWKLSSPGKPGWLAPGKLPVAVAVAVDQDATKTPATPLGFALPTGLSVKVFNDADGSGTQQSAESSKAGWKVTAVGGPDNLAVSTTTDANGVARFEGLVPGQYRLSVATSGDWRLGTGSSVTTTDGSTAATPGFSCDTDGCSTVLVQETSQVATMPVRNPNSWLSVTPFNDLNNDGVKQDKEKTLSGWFVTAHGGPDGYYGYIETGNDGRAGFYPVSPGRYTLQMVSPRPSSDPDVLDWTATNRTGCVPYEGEQKLCEVQVDVIAGETGRAAFGFVQLGTISVGVFHDYDRDGIQDDWEPDQPNRTVTLYDGTGKKVQQRKVTANEGENEGHVAFKVSAGVKYQVGVALPTGWVQTSPVDGRGRPVTKVPVVGPLGIESTPLEFGQYNTADSIPPPAPTSSRSSGVYTETQSVELTSETGATIRYTLSGAKPTATTGLVYTGPITVSATLLLRAIAVDPAGNASPELTDPDTGTGVMITVTRSGTTTTTMATADNWTVLVGGTPAPPSGSDLSAALAADDASRLILPSGYVHRGKKHVVDGYATVPVGNVGSPVSLTVEVDGRSNLTGSGRSLALWDFAAGQWVALTDAEPQGLVDTRTVIDAASPLDRFVGNGQVRIRLTSERKSGAFDVHVDQVLVKVTS